MYCCEMSYIDVSSFATHNGIFSKKDCPKLDSPMDIVCIEQCIISYKNK